MKNKKITSLLVAGALTVGIVGGTLAWLTASDSVRNAFKTGSHVDNVANVEIYEKFDKSLANAIYPNQVVTKKVQIQNKLNSEGQGVNQFIRVKKPVINLVDKNGLETEFKGAELGFVNISTIPSSPSLGSWVDGEDGYYYYVGIVAPGRFTSQLLDRVIFPADIPENANYRVDIIAESVQAGADAFADQWKLDMNKGVGKTLKVLQDGQTENDFGLIDGLQETAEADKVQ